MTTIRITHHYDKGNQDMYLSRKSGDVDPLRAALFCQFKCEEWHGQHNGLTNLGVAAMLVMHYGFRQEPVADHSLCRTIDMYVDREKACGPLYFELMADLSLNRDGLREHMANFVA